MSILKITLGTLAVMICVCSVMYYFTLYQNPPGPAVTEPPISSIPTAAVIVPSVTATATPEIMPPKPVKKKAAPRPRKTPKPHKMKRKSQQIFPFGKPKPTPKPE